MGNFNRGNSGGGARREGGSNFGGGFQRSFDDNREKHKAVCADCGQECEVPFKPVEGKPVYCRDCYRKRRAY